ncbi:MAG TPA: hypothetical protein VFM09_11060 [Marmoricola sp.]|nr:hypothetical protein [Marmoricola sp.]
MSDERRLAESLQRRAAGFAPQQAGMDQVVRRARRIRRRRRTTVSALTAAAVAAIAIPTGLTLGGGPEATPPVPAHPGTPSPSVSPSLSPSPSTPSTPAPSTPVTASSTPAPPATPSLRLGQIRPGPPLEIGWLEGRTWHNGSGATQTLPAGHYTAITPYHGGFLVTATHDSGGRLSGAVGEVTWLDNTMQPQWTACGSQRLALSGDQTIAIYSRLASCAPDARDTLHAGIASGMGQGETVRPVTTGQLADPVGQTDQVVVYNLASLRDGTPGGVWYTNLAQQQPAKQVPGLSHASGVNTARQQVSGASDSRPGSGVVVDPVTGKVVWSLKDWWPGQFTADGKYVVASHSAGGEPDAYAILDAGTGAFVQRLDLSRYGMQVTATAWAPDDSLLLQVHQGDRQAVVRLTLTGKVTRAGAVMPADPAHAVVFATQP